MGEGLKRARKVARAIRKKPKEDSKLNIAAFVFVDGMSNRADGWINGGWWWHGWALREAFLAGAHFEREKHK